MRALLSFFISILFTSVFAQQTVGLFWNDSFAYNGYTLFSPSASHVTYLIDNCGNKVHSWQTGYEPGLTGYLLENGNLLRAARTNTNITFRAGGAAGRVELFDWDGNLLWYYERSDSIKCTNHDVQALPNGNVLLLSFYDITADTAIALGRNPATVDVGFWDAHIIEVQPTGMGTGNIVWEWHASDHTVQDFDNTKPNFGVIGANPHKININYPNNLDVDWLHMNGIDYNPEFDQILVSVHRFNEFWVIDHSTTTTEAAGSTGGNLGKGGDLLYRWGNPAAYKRGMVADQILYEQHDARWIPTGYPNAGKITVYNNGQGRPEGEYSTVDMIVPPVDANGNYTLMPGQPFGPDSLFYRYTASPPLSFYSRNISGVQALPNGNILVCEGAQGRLFEIGPNDSIVWQYIVPVNSIGPITQGNSSVANNTFQAYRYGPNYPAFLGKDLSPKGPIELNPLPSDCQIYIDDTTDTTSAGHIPLPKIEVYPNPVESQWHVNLPRGGNATLVITNAVGALLVSHPFDSKTVLDVSHLPVGLYFYQITLADGQAVMGKLLKE